MAGFNTIVDDFEVATCEMHMNTPAGQPAYAVLLGDSVDIAIGSWNIQRNEDGLEISRKAIPPVKKGAEVRPCKMVLRSPYSPDAKRFRDDRNCKITFDDIAGLKTGKDGVPIFPSDDMARIWWASFVADFIDLPHEEKGVTKLAIYSEESTLECLTKFPGLAAQMQRVMFNLGNFEKPTNNG